MRSALLMALGLALGCGRSELIDQGYEAPAPANGASDDDGATGDDMGSSGDDAVPSADDGPVRFYGDCGPDTCAHGCCNVDGFCVEQLSDQACGWGGSACTACSPDAVCVESSGCAPTLPPPTSTPPPPPPAGRPCNPQNCGGCCSGNVCAVGSQTIACGSGGKSCIDCTAFGMAVCFMGSCSVNPRP